MRKKITDKYTRTSKIFLYNKNIMRAAEIPKSAQELNRRVLVDFWYFQLNCDLAHSAIATAGSAYRKTQSIGRVAAFCQKKKITLGTNSV